MIDMLPARSITHDMMKMPLSYLMFLKMKRNGLVKGRGCADGSPQQEFISKIKSSSPCVKTHALFLSCIVDAFENRCVVIADIPAAFLLADWPADAQDCHIRFEEVMVEILCQIKPEYRKLIKYSRRKSGRLRKVLVGKIFKAIYGTLLGAISFYKKLRGVLMDMGFKTNGFDECTFNKMIDGYQYTIQVHVDDLKLSFVRQNELDKIIAALNKIFGSDGDLLTASYGKVNEYLGMDIDWSTEGMVVFTMYDYLEDILDESIPEFDGGDVTPAVSELFTVNMTHQKLDTPTSELFHRIVAKFLYIAKRARPDLQVAVAFLCKRVKCPNVGDWKKLGRLVRYVWATIHLPLTVGWNRTGNMV